MRGNDVVRGVSQTGSCRSRTAVAFSKISRGEERSAVAIISELQAEISMYI